MSKEKCFIITPIGNKNDEIRRHIDGIIDAVIKPAIEDKYEIVVSHKINDIGSINKQIIREIYADKLVIANLTTINPNVMYELAFRHSIGKPVVVIAEEGTNLPFDISVERTIFYRNDALGTIELQQKLKEFIDNIDFEIISGPIHDVIKEYNQESFFIKNYESYADQDNVDSLKFIINRLNSIEDSINNIEIDNYRNTFPHYTETVIGFADYDKSIKEEQIFNVLQRVEKLIPNYEILDFKLNKNAKQITIYELLKSPIPIPELYDYYKTELTQLGFVGVKMDFCKNN